MTGVLIRGDKREQENHRRDGHVEMEAGTGVMQLEAKDGLQPKGRAPQAAQW